MKITILQDVSFNKSSFPFSNPQHDPDLTSISEVFEDDLPPMIGLASPPCQLILCIGPPPPTQVVLPPSPVTESSVFETAESTPYVSPNPVSSSHPVRDRHAPERYSHFGGLAFNAQIIPPGDPLTYRQALSSPDCQHWQEAMNEEFQSLHE